MKACKEQLHGVSMADSSEFTFCSLLISSEHSQSSSKQVLKTSPCVYLNKTQSTNNSSTQMMSMRFPSRPIKVRMGKAANSRTRKWQIWDDRSWSHDHWVSKQTNKQTNREIGLRLGKDTGSAAAVFPPLSRLDTFPATRLWEGERQGYFPHTCMKRLRVSAFKEWWLLVELPEITALRQHRGDCHKNNKYKWHTNNIISMHS